MSIPSSRALSAVLVSGLVGLVACASSSSKAVTRSTSVRSASTTSAGTPTGSTSSGAATTGPAATTTTTTAQREVNPPGDIPDTQAFVAFTPAGGGYTISVPEGWARTDAEATTTFTDKYNSAVITLAATPTAPTEASVRAIDVPILARQPEFVLRAITTVARTAGPAILTTYSALSAVNPVTGKVATLDVERYELWNAGRLLTVTLAGPAGSDNVDPWRTVTDSLRWSR